MVLFEDHLAHTEPAIQLVLRELRTRISGLDRLVTESVTAHRRIAYSVVRVFAEVKIQKKKRVLVRVFDAGLPDSKNLVVDIPELHGWSHQKQISIDRIELVDYAMAFVAASYQASLQDQPEVSSKVSDRSSHHIKHHSTPCCARELAFRRLKGTSGSRSRTMV